MAEQKNSDISEILDIVSRMEQSLIKDVEKHERTLYGNGQPGLVTRITTLENGGKVIMTAIGALFAAGAAAAVKFFGVG